MSSSSQGFSGKLRSLFWPIYGGEYKKFVPMLLIFFLIAFVYNMLRAVKDALVVTAPDSGAEVLPFIKVWVMLPTAFIFTFIFSGLSNRFDRNKVIYVMISIFLVFFAIFTFVLYPLRDLLHPYGLANKLSAFLPLGFKGLIAIFRNWTLTLFYVMSEMWGTFILTVIFWGFANEVTSVSEAKRFYPLFGVGANFSSIFSGNATLFLSSIPYHPSFFFGQSAWDQSIFYLTFLILIIGGAILAIFRHLQTKVFPLQSAHSSIHLPKKEKISLRKNFSYLAGSKYLICIAIIVVAYNITINLTEVLWKNQVKALYPLPVDYFAYMGQVMIFMGIIATSIAVFISSNFLRKFGWTLTALLTPLVVLVTGAAFFLCSTFKSSLFLSSISSLISYSPLALCVFFGSLQNIMARSTKYTLFDATKEIAFIPLSSESKSKGKAAIDGVGSRIGKSGGSVIHQGLLILLSTLSAATPYVGIIFFFIVIAWIIATVSLGKKFSILTTQKETLPGLSSPTEKEPLVKEEQSLS
jgi:ATP:ADP antiporter, AAA family